MFAAFVRSTSSSILGFGWKSSYKTCFAFMALHGVVKGVVKGVVVGTRMSAEPSREGATSAVWLRRAKPRQLAGWHVQKAGSDAG